MSVGDTFSTVVNNPEYNNCPIDMVVTAIDTVILENNEQRQRFTFDGEQWISGIGSLYGLFLLVLTIVSLTYHLN